VIRWNLGKWMGWGVEVFDLRPRGQESCPFGPKSQSRRRATRCDEGGRAGDRDLPIFSVTRKILRVTEVMIK